VCYKFTLFYVFKIVLPADGFSKKAATLFLNKKELLYPQVAPIQ